MSARALLIAVLWAAPALAVGPFEKNHPLVEDGTAAYDAGDFERALDRYDAAAKERPTDARVHYDRGLALHKLGRDADARQAFARAQELDKQGELTSKLHYNLGNLAAADGDKQGAIREYRKALKADPNDALARHNLEVLLRDLPPKESAGADGGTPDGGKSDGGRPDAGFDGGVTDGGSDAGRPDGGPRDGGQGDGGSEDAGRPDGGADGGTQPRDGGPADGGGQGDGGQGDAGTKDGGADGGQPSPDGGKADGGEADKQQQADGGSDGGMEPQDGGAQAQAKPGLDGGASRKDAEDMLDAFKSNEKNHPLWRFKQKTQKNDSHGKDW